MRIILYVLKQALFVVTFITLFSTISFAQEIQDSLLTQRVVTSDSILPIQDNPLRTNSEIDSLIKENIEFLRLVNPTDTNYLNLMHDYDLLITRKWKIMVVKVKNIQKDNIEFLYPLNTQINTINRNETSQVLFANGNHEVFHPLEKRNEKDSVNIERVVIHDKKDWEKVIVVELANDVPAPFIEIGKVDALFEADQINATNDFLEKNVLIILRKKTANLEGYYLLITDKKVNRAYGEIPIITMEGTVFGYVKKKNPNSMYFDY